MTCILNNHNGVIRLTDGRRLAYAEYGPADGKPVIAFHGTPGSRLEQICDLATLTALNIRLIIADRPGYGFSDFQENRRLLDWPDDVTQLADALDFELFSILGFSGGGAYAAACAFKIPQRLNHVALISSAAPFDAPGVIDAMLPANRALFELGARDYRQLEQQLTAIIETPEILLNMLEGPAPTPDKAIFAHQHFRQMYLLNLAESLRQGLAGVACDMSLAALPWGFDPAAIHVKVSLWHGSDDINTPLAMGQHLATTIPDCRAYILPDAGHFMMFANSQEILQSLIDES